MSEINTLKELRNTIGITQSELAAEAGVSRHSVLRQEQMCYPSPLPNIIAALSDITGQSERSLVEQYKIDVKRNRDLAQHIYFYDHQLMWKAYIRADTPTKTGKHPFQVWREALFEFLGENDSRIHFCSVTSIHPATLSKYESFKTGFPAGMEVALLESGVPEDLVKRFKTEGVFNTVGD